VTQDEYTHDVVLELAGDCFFVYDTATALKTGDQVLGYAACIVSAEHRHRSAGT